MQYSLEQMHQPKPCGERRNGKTVDAIVDIIGKVMVTEHETIYLVLRLKDWERHAAQEFKMICFGYFDVIPNVGKVEWKIQGYSSRVVTISIDQYDQDPWRYCRSTIPTFDV